MIELKHRWTGEVLYTSEAYTVGATIVEAHENGKSLKYVLAPNVNLNFKDLRGIDLEEADLSNSFFIHSNLSGCNLINACLTNVCFKDSILSDANLRHANINGSTLSHANFSGANLSLCKLSRAYLNYANFSKTILPWGSHEVCSEILRQNAGTDTDKLKIASLILMQTNWCWSNFFELNDPLTDWAAGVLSDWAWEETQGIPPELLKWMKDHNVERPVRRLRL